MRKRYYIRSLIFIFVLFVFMGAKVWAQDNSLIEERKVEVLEPHILKMTQKLRLIMSI